MQINIGRLKSEWRRANKTVVVVCAALTLLAGLLSTAVTFALGGRSMIYGYINLPIWAPPRFVFPLVWTVLYILIGGAAGMILSAFDCGREADKYKGLLLFVVMMIFNVIWSPLFFAAFAYLLALLDIFIMLVLTFFIIITFKRIRILPAVVMTVYFAWLCFAALLNISVVILN